MAINYEEKRQQNQEQVNYDYFAHNENQQEQGFFEKYKPETPDDRKRKKSASVDSGGNSGSFAESIRQDGKFDGSGADSAGFLKSYIGSNDDGSFTIDPNAYSYSTFESTQRDNKPFFYNDVEKQTEASFSVARAGTPDMSGLKTYDELKNFFLDKSYYSDNIVYWGVINDIENKNTYINNKGEQVFDEDRALEEAKDFINSLYIQEADKDYREEFKERKSSLKYNDKGQKIGKDQRKKLQEYYTNDVERMRDELNDSDIERARFTVMRLTKSYLGNHVKELEKFQKELREKMSEGITLQGYDVNGIPHYVKEYDREKGYDNRFYARAEKTLRRAIRHANSFINGDVMTLTAIQNDMGNLLTLGLESVSDNVSKGRMVKKLKDGEELTEGEKAYAKAVVMSESIDNMVNKVDLYSHYDAAQAITESLVYMEGFSLAASAVRGLGLVGRSEMLASTLLRGAGEGAKDLKTAAPSIMKGLKASKGIAQKAGYAAAQAAYDAETIFATSFMTPMFYNETAKRYAGKWAITHDEEGNELLVMTQDDFEKAFGQMDTNEKLYKGLMEYTMNFIRAANEKGGIEKLKETNKEAWVNWCKGMDIDPEGDLKDLDVQKVYDVIDECKDRLMNIAKNKSAMSTFEGGRSFAESVLYGAGTTMRANFTEVVVGPMFDDLTGAIGRRVFSPVMMKGKTNLQLAREWQHMGTGNKIVHAPHMFWTRARNGYVPGVLSSMPGEMAEEYFENVIPNVFADPEENLNDRREILTRKFAEQTAITTLAIGALGNAKSSIAQSIKMAPQRRMMNDIIGVLDDLANGRVDTKDFSRIITSVVGNGKNGPTLDPHVALRYMSEFTQDKIDGVQKNMYMQMFMNNIANLAAHTDTEYDFMVALKRARDNAAKTISAGENMQQDVMDAIEVYTNVAKHMNALEEVKQNYGDRFWVDDIIDSESSMNMYRMFRDTYYDMMWKFFNIHAMTDENGVLDDDTKRRMFEELIDTQVEYDKDGNMISESYNALVDKALNMMDGQFADTDMSGNSRDFDNFMVAINLYQSAKNLYESEVERNKVLKGNDIEKAAKAYSESHKEEFTKAMSQFMDLTSESVEEAAKSAHIQLTKKEVDNIVYNSNKDRERKHFDKATYEKGLRVSDESKNDIIRAIREGKSEKSVAVNVNGEIYVYNPKDDSFEKSTKDNVKELGLKTVNADGLVLDYAQAAANIRKLYDKKSKLMSPAIVETSNAFYEFGKVVKKALENGDSIDEIFDNLPELGKEHFMRDVAILANNKAAIAINKYKSEHEGKEPEDLDEIPILKSMNYKENIDRIDELINSEIKVTKDSGTSSSVKPVVTVEKVNDDGRKPEHNTTPVKKNEVKVNKNAEKTIVNTSSGVIVKLPNMMIGYSYDSESKVYKTTRNENNNDELSKNIISKALYEDKDNTLYARASNGKIIISVYDFKGKYDDVLILDPNSNYLLSHDYFKTFIDSIRHLVPYYDTDDPKDVYNLLKTFENNYYDNGSISKDDFNDFVESLKEKGINVKDSYEDIIKKIKKDSEKNKRELKKLYDTLKKKNDSVKINIDQRSNDNINYIKLNNESFARNNGNAIAGRTTIHTDKTIVVKEAANGNEVTLTKENCENFNGIIEHLKNIKNNKYGVNIVFWREPTNKYRAIIPDLKPEIDEKNDIVKTYNFLKWYFEDKDNSNMNVLKKLESMGYDVSNYKSNDEAYKNFINSIEKLKYVYKSYPKNVSGSFIYETNQDATNTNFIIFREVYSEKEQKNVFGYFECGRNEFYMRATPCNVDFINNSNNTHPDIYITIEGEHIEEEKQNTSSTEANEVIDELFNTDEKIVEESEDEPESEIEDTEEEPTELVPDESPSDAERNGNDINSETTENDDTEKIRKIEFNSRMKYLEKRMAEALFHRLMVSVRDKKNLSLSNIYENIETVISNWAKELDADEKTKEYADFLRKHKRAIVGYNIGLNCNRFGTVKYYVDSLFGLRSTSDYIENDDLEDAEITGSSADQAVDFTKDYDSDVFERELPMSMSMRAKLMFIGIRKTKSRMSNPKSVIEEYESPDAMYYGMHDLMSRANSNSMSALKAKAEELISNSSGTSGIIYNGKFMDYQSDFEFYRQILDNLEKTDDRTRNEILSILYTDKVDMLFTAISNENEGMTLYKANSGEPDTKFIRQVADNFKKSDMMKQKKNGRYYIANIDRANEVIAIVKDVNKIILNNERSLTYDEYRRFKSALKSFGLDVNDSFVINMTSGNELSKEFLSTLASKAAMLEKIISNGATNYEFNLDRTYQTLLRNPSIYLNGVLLDEKDKENISYSYVRSKDFYKQFVNPYLDTHFIPTRGTYIAKKRIPSYELPRFYKQRFKTIKNAVINDDEEFLGQLESSAYSGKSELLKFMRAQKEYLQYINIRQYSLQALKYLNSKGTQDNREITRLSEKDRLAVFLSGFTNTKIKSPENFIDKHFMTMPFMGISDSRNMPCIETVGYYINRNSKKGMSILPGGTVDEVERNTFESGLTSGANIVFNHVVMPEIDRIIEFYSKMGDKSTGISGTDIGSQMIFSLPTLNALKITINKERQEGGNVVKEEKVMTFLEYLYENKSFDDRDDNFSTIKSLIIEEIKKKLEERTNQYISKDEKGKYTGKFEDYGFIEYGNESTVNVAKFIDKDFLDNMVDASSTKSVLEAFTNSVRLRTNIETYIKLRHLALEYVVNSMTNQTDLAMLFTTDPANYYSEKEAANEHFQKDDVWGRNMSMFQSEKGNERYSDEWFTEAREEYVKIAKETSENMTKRSKAMVSPGMKESDYTLKNCMQIMLQDNYGPSMNVPYLAKTLNDDESKNEALDKLIEEYNKAVSDNRSTLNIVERIGKLIPEVKDYVKMELTNAQEYVTWKTHLNIMYSRGKLTKDQYDKIFEKLQSQSLNGLNESNMLTRDEVSGIFQTEKPLYSGICNKEVNGYNLQSFVFVKTSAIPLIPQLCIGFELDDVRKRMEDMEYEYNNMKVIGNNVVFKDHKTEVKNGMDFITGVRLSFNSGNKVGAPKNSATLDEFRNGYDITDSVVKLESLNFSIQQDKPFEKHDDVNLSTQITKVIISNGISQIKDNVFEINKDVFDGLGLIDDMNIEFGDDGKAKISGIQLKRIYNSIYEKMEEELKRDVLDFFRINNPEDILQNKRSFEKMIEYLNNRLTNIQDYEALERVFVYRKKDGSGKVEISTRKLTKKEVEEKNLDMAGFDFNIPVWALPNAKRFETLLNSVINKFMIKLRMPGAAGIVASEETFKFKTMDMSQFGENAKYGGVTFVQGYDPKGGLKSYVEGDVPVYECLIANKFRDNEGNLIDLKEFMDDNGFIDTERFQKELLDVPSLRIPVSSHQSGMLLRIVGFVPYESGDVLVAPRDALVQLGEDYDIDTRYFYLDNTIVEKNKDGKKTIRRINFEDTKKRPKDIVEVTTENIFNKEIIDDLSERIKKDSDIKRVTLCSYKDFIDVINDYIKENSKFVEDVTRITPTDAQYIAEKIYDKSSINKKYGKGEIADRTVRTIRSKAISFIADFIHSNAIFAFQLKEENGDNITTKKVTKLDCLQNALNGVFKAVYMSGDKEVRKMISMSLSTDFAKSTADLIAKKTHSEFVSYFDPIYQENKIMSGNSGKDGVAFHSSFLTASALFQTASDAGMIRFKNKNLVFGRIKSDGAIGRVDSIVPTGTNVKPRKISTLHMENQNVSVDNVKLGIMSIRNENDNTIGVYATMAALGIDKDVMKDGTEIHYPSFFMTQPIVIKFVELCNKYYSYTYNEVDPDTGAKLFGESLRKKIYKELSDMLGLDASNKEINEKKSELTADTLYGMIGKDVKDLTDNEKLLQRAVLENLKELLGMQEKMNALQKMMNIEKNGVGNSYFDTVNMHDFFLRRINNMEDDLIENVKNIFGEYDNITNVRYDEKGYDKKANDEIIKRKIKEGYILVGIDSTGSSRGKFVFVKPTTMTGHKILNSMMLSYNMYGKIFPYDDPVIRGKIERIARSMDVDIDDMSTTRKEQIMASLKDYMNTALLSTKCNVDYMREHLFFDSESNTSLASYLISVITRSSHVSKLDFFKDITLEVKSGYPSTISYNAGFESVDVRNSASNVFVDMCNGPMSQLYIKDDNGKYILWDGERMTYRDLCFNLLVYSFLANQENGATGFRPYIPLSVYSSFGLAENMRSMFNIENFRHDMQFNNNGVKAEIEARLGSGYTVESDIIEMNITDYVSDNGIDSVNKIVNDINSRYPVDIIRVVKTLEVGINGGKEYKYYIRQNVSCVGDMESNRFVKQYFQHNPWLAKVYLTNDENFYNGKKLPDTIEYNNNNGSAEFVKIRIGKNLGLYQLTNMVENNRKVKKYVRIPVLGSTGYNEYNSIHDVNESLTNEKKNENIRIRSEVIMPENINIRYSTLSGDRYEVFTGLDIKNKNMDSNVKNYVEILKKIIWNNNVVESYLNGNHIYEISEIHEFLKEDTRTIEEIFGDIEWDPILGKYKDSERNVKPQRDFKDNRHNMLFLLYTISKMKYGPADTGSDIAYNNIRNVATMLSKMNRGSYPTIEFVEDNEAYFGKYDNDEDVIKINLTEINKSGENKIYLINKTILHEYIHHLTQNIIDNYVKISVSDEKGIHVEYKVPESDVPSDVMKICMIWRKAYEVLSKEYNNDTFRNSLTGYISNEKIGMSNDDATMAAYAISNINEMFVSMFFDEKFKEKLKNVEYKNSGKSLFRSFFNSIFNLFKKIFKTRTDTLLASMFESFYEICNGELNNKYNEDDVLNEDTLDELNEIEQEYYAISEEADSGADVNVDAVESAIENTEC